MVRCLQVVTLLRARGEALDARTYGELIHLSLLAPAAPISLIHRVSLHVVI